MTTDSWLALAAAVSGTAVVAIAPDEATRTGTTAPVLSPARARRPPPAAARPQTRSQWLPVPHILGMRHPIPGDVAGEEPGAAARATS